MGMRRRYTQTVVQGTESEEFPRIRKGDVITAPGWDGEPRDMLVLDIQPIEGVPGESEMIVEETMPETQPPV